MHSTSFSPRLTTSCNCNLKHSGVQILHTSQRFHFMRPCIILSAVSPFCHLIFASINIYCVNKTYHGYPVSCHVWNLQNQILSQHINDTSEKFLSVIYFIRGIRWRSWLRHCECRGFDSWWCQWNFSFTQSLWQHYGLGVDSASNRNEYQEYFLGG